MAMTAAVKDELSRLPVTKKCCRKAEVSALLRFAGGFALIAAASSRFTRFVRLGAKWLLA